MPSAFTPVAPVVAGGGGGGTSDHRALSHRNDADQHPIVAVTGLAAALTAAGEAAEVEYICASLDGDVFQTYTKDVDGFRTTNPQDVSAADPGIRLLVIPSPGVATLYTTTGTGHDGGVDAATGWYISTIENPIAYVVESAGGVVIWPPPLPPGGGGGDIDGGVL